MFSWFRRPKHHHKRNEDCVWLSDEARLKGVTSRCQDILRAGGAVVVVAQSTQTIEDLLKVCEDSKVQVVAAHQLSPFRLRELAQDASILSLLQIGAMSNPNGEEKLLVQSDPLPFTIELQIHLTLPELSTLGIETGAIESLLKKLDVKEDEAITHKWVSRAITNARRAKRG